MKNPTKSQALKHSINELTIGWSKMACCRHTVSEGIRSIIPTKKKWSAARHPHVAFAWQNNTLVEKVDWCKLTSACSLKNCHCCTHFYFFQISFNRKIWIFQTGRRRMSDASSNESKSGLWKKKQNISTSLLTPGHQVRHLFKRVIITRPDYRRFLFKNWGAAQGTFQWKAS